MILGIIIIVAFVALTILGIYARSQLTKKLAAYAAARGWRFDEQRPDLVDVSAHPPFATGTSRKVRYAMSGVLHGRAFTSFQYQYTISSGKSTTRYYYHVTMIQLPGRTPYLSVAPESIVDKMFKFAGLRDIQFESDAFNKAWFVTAGDKMFAFDIVNPQLMTWLMQPQNRAVNFRMENGLLITAQSGRIKLPQIEAHTLLLNTLANEIPGFVWQKLGITQG